MSENLQMLLKEALNNNSYNHASMNGIIKKTWENSFSYLYTLQKSYIEYEEFFYYSNNQINRDSKKIGHLYLDRLNNACFDIDYDLIHIYSREEYRRSDFYLKDISFMDLVNNPLIFLKIPVVIIDGQMIWDYKIKITKDCTSFILPFKRNFVIDDKRDPNSTMRYNTYTILANGEVSAKDPSGDPLDLDVHFLPARVYHSRTHIIDGYIEGKGITQVLDEIKEEILDYYTIDEISDDKIVLTAVSDDIIYIDHDIQVLVVDNVFYQRLELNKISLSFNKENKTIRIAKNLLNDIPEQQGQMFCSIHIPNDNGKKYELGTTLINLREEENYYFGDLTDDLVSLIDESRRSFYVSIVFFNRLNLHTFYTGSTSTISDGENANLIVLEEENMKPYAMPIPVENFLVMKKDIDGDGGYKIIKNDLSIEMYYPNIYRICDSEMKDGDEYKIYYFYYNGYDLRYTPVHEFYFMYLSNLFGDRVPIEEIIDKVYRNKIDFSGFTPEQSESFKETFNYILSYQYYHHDYGDTDFLWRYTKLPGNEDKDPLEYKVETTKEWVKHDPFMLDDYVIEQKKKGLILHMFTNTIDLTKRLRKDTSLELGSKYVFDEDMYVFALSNKLVYPDELNCRVFVDGLFVNNLYQERKVFMDYIYIPTSMVTNDSYIEIEIFREYKLEKQVIFDTMDSTESFTVLEPDENISPTIADFVVIDGTDNESRYDNEFFNIVAHYEEGDFLVPFVDDKTNQTKFTRLVNFTVSPNDEIVVGKPLNMRVSKIAHGIRMLVTEKGYPYIELIESQFGFHSDFIRIFVNGRLLPRCKYVFYSTYNCPRVLFLDEYQPGDEIFIDVTPYRYTEIYYQEELTNPIVDLKGIINKPFDIRYYDVYLNGRRMSLNNVMTIDPWSITFVNLKSKYNLLILEKERDFEYFGLDYTSNLYYFSVEDLLNKNFMSEEQKKELIKDLIDKQKDDRLNIYPNTNDEEKQDYTDLSFYAKIAAFYFNELIPKTFVNPDVKQFSQTLLRDEYETIYKNYMVTQHTEDTDPVLKERHKNNIKALRLNPDHIIKGETTDDTTYVYAVGHLDDVEEDIINQDISIDTSNIITS